jgi:hypothetical protein
MKNCDVCINNLTDEDGGHYCTWMGSMDEDEMERLMSRADAPCPFWEPGDEYKIVQKQN